MEKIAGCWTVNVIPHTIQQVESRSGELKQSRSADVPYSLRGQSCDCLREWGSRQLHTQGLARTNGAAALGNPQFMRGSPLLNVRSVTLMQVRPDNTISIRSHDFRGSEHLFLLRRGKRATGTALTSRSADSSSHHVTLFQSIAHARHTAPISAPTMLFPEILTCSEEQLCRRYRCLRASDLSW